MYFTPTLMPASYSAGLVALSYIISFVGAFTALTAASRIVRANGTIDRLNVLEAGVALGGIGVWSMHFVGMLALQVQMGTAYSMVETAASLVAAIIATSAALYLIARRPQNLAYLAGAGITLGLAVCVMHYLGMYGMRFNGFIHWQMGVVSASIGIAVAAATAALWLSFRVRGLPVRIAASLVMAAAVCAMHYTGMAAADFMCTTASPWSYPAGWGVVPSPMFRNLVAIVALGLAGVTMTDQFFQWLQEQRLRRQREEAAAAIRATRPPSGFTADAR